MTTDVKILAGITVIDLGLGKATALIAKYLAEMGADITRIEPSSGDPFYAMYPAYEIWHQQATILSEDESDLNALLSKADICIIGGEDHPDVVRRTNGLEIANSNPRLVVINIEAFPEGTLDAGRPTTDLLAQARSGLCWESFTDRPVPMSFSPTAHAAAIRGLSGAFAALYEREASGRGQLVATSLYEAAFVWAAGVWSDIEKPTPATDFVMPKDPFPLVFQCADGVYIHLVIGAPGSKYKMYQALEIDDPSVKPNDVSMPQPGNPRKFFGDVDVLAEHVAKFDSQELLERIWERGLPAEPVLPPGGCWEMPQVQHNGIIETDEKGRRYVGLPLVLRAVPAERQTLESKGKQPLSGVRVVDMGQFVAGPYASTILGDLGAEVIKIEALTKDANRAIFRSYSPCNRGKRAIAVNMKEDAGLAIAKALCVGSDVVTSNFRTGVSKRIGVDPHSLHKENPKLVVLESPGYGSSGPLAERAAFDMVFQALCGHEYRGGGEGNPPQWNRTTMVDYAAGMLGGLACIAGLYHTARSGEGLFLDSPLLNSGLYLCSDVIKSASGDLLESELLNSQCTGYSTDEAFYQTEDGWIAIAARNAAAQAGLMSTLNIELPNDASNWGDSELQVIAGELVKLSTSDAISRLSSAGVWVEECREGMEASVLQDEDLLKVNAVHDSVHPSFGRVREMGTMLRFSRSSVGNNGYAQAPGESTKALLQELGRTDADIEALYEAGVVG